MDIRTIRLSDLSSVPVRNGQRSGSSSQAAYFGGVVADVLTRQMVRQQVAVLAPPSPSQELVSLVEMARHIDILAAQYLQSQFGVYVYGTSLAPHRWLCGPLPASTNCE